MALTTNRLTGIFNGVTQKRAEATRANLIKAATEVIRRKGYFATTVDQVCERAKVSKGAFFHHFKTKEELAEACLVQWDERAAAMEASSPFQKTANPRDRVLAYMDFYIGVFENPKILKSCLAGTTAQEVGDTIPALRDAANQCFCNAARRLQSLLDDACKGVRQPPETSSLAALWIATVQGAIVLYKASRDKTLITRTLQHVRNYITSILPNGSAETST